MADITTLFQQGTMAALTAGLYDGTLSIASLLEHGDTGIGTADQLDGELVILDGQAFQVKGTGEVVNLAPETKVPFAEVHFDQNANSKSVVGMDGDKIADLLIKEYKMTNIFTAIKIVGTFGHVHTRAVMKQQKPYPSFTEATRLQPQFDREQVAGTLIGYYAPALYQGVTVAGMHLHFISSQHDFGGHVLDFAIDQAEIAVQQFETFVQNSPIENEDYRNVQIDLETLSEDINKTES